MKKGIIKEEKEEVPSVNIELKEKFPRGNSKYADNNCYATHFTG